MKLLRKATEDEKATYPFIFLACLLLFYMLGLPLVVLKADFWLGMALIVPPAFGMGALILILGREIHREKRWKEMWLVIWQHGSDGEGAWQMVAVHARTAGDAMPQGMKIIRERMTEHQREMAKEFPDLQEIRAIRLDCIPPNYIFTQEE